MSKAQKALDPKPREENVNFGLDDKARETIAQNLSAILADTYALLVKTHIYHWNVVGPLFHSIHEMTEEQYNDLFKATDEIAERIRALGYRAPVVGNKGHDIVIELGAESKTESRTAGRACSGSSPLALPVVSRASPSSTAVERTTSSLSVFRWSAA